MNGIVIIPTFNEAANIEPLVQQILSQPVALDILIVDDNSPDGTGQIADDLARDWPVTQGRVHVLHRAGKEGLGRAYIAGFGWAMERGYGLLIEMDADFSHDPFFLGSLAEAAKGADIVLGSRYLHGISVVNWPLQRILLSWGANRYVRSITGLKATDCTSGYRAYRREVLETIELDTITSSGYSFQVEMTFRAHMAGFHIAEVPIVFTERRTGSSKMSPGVIWESVLLPWKLRLGLKGRKAIRKQPLLHLVKTEESDPVLAESHRKAA